MSLWPLSDRNRPKVPSAESPLEERLSELLQAAELRMVKRLEARINTAEDSLRQGFDKSIKGLQDSLMAGLESLKASSPARPSPVIVRPNVGSPENPGRGTSVESPVNRKSLDDDAHELRSSLADAAGPSSFNRASSAGSPGGRNRRKRNSAGGELFAGRAEKVWSLVEGDMQIRSMLADVRKQIGGNADKSDASAAKRVKSPDGPSSSDGRKNKISRRIHTPTGTTVCHYVCGPVVHPDSRFRMFWNVILSTLICYCGIAVPLEIAFEQDMVESMCEQGRSRGNCADFLVWFWLNLCVDMFFIADIVVNFRTGYIREGHFVKDDWLAARNYLRGSFILDVLGSFPLNLLLMIAHPQNPYGDIQEVGNSTPGVDRLNRMLRLLRLTKLAKLARMFKLAKYLEGAERLMNPGVLSVIKLVVIMLLCCHWFGCLWWLVSDLELSEAELLSPWFAGQNTWHPPQWLKATSLHTKYMHAFFWGAGMVTSMVPRDIEPTTSLEAFITTFTMFFGLMLNALVISSLTTTLSSMDSKKEFAGKQLDAIRNFLIIKSVPADLRSRILEYYEYLFTSSAALADLNMFSNMPPALHAQLNLSVNRKLAARCAFFRDVSNASLVTLISDLKPLVFVPGQTIVVEGHALTAVYFINKGIVQLLNHGELLCTLRDNENFGLDDYLAASMTSGDVSAEGAVTHTAKALTYCDVMSLGVSTLFEVMLTDEQFQRRVRESRPADYMTEMMMGYRLKIPPMRIGGKWRQNRTKLQAAAAEVSALHPDRVSGGDGGGDSGGGSVGSSIGSAGTRAGGRLFGVASLVTASKDACKDGLASMPSLPSRLPKDGSGSSKDGRPPPYRRTSLPSRGKNGSGRATTKLALPCTPTSTLPSGNCVAARVLDGGVALPCTPTSTLPSGNCVAACVLDGGVGLELDDLSA